MEKPTAPTLGEADEIILAAERAGVRMMVSLILHFESTCVAAYERIKAGEIGEVLTMFACRKGTVLGAHHMGSDPTSSFRPASTNWRT